MSHPFRTLADYELFLYTLAERHPSVRHSSLILVRRGTSLARVEGEVLLEGGGRIVVRERVVADRLPLVIDGYGYEIWQSDEKLCWYDSQPHPDEPSLQTSHPHHKHVPPNMRQNRVPAPRMSFTQPNLPVLIAEVEALSKNWTGKGVNPL